MSVWNVPAAQKPRKSKKQLREERIALTRLFLLGGVLKSPRIQQALLTVPREDFLPYLYQDHAYLDLPLPLPAEHTTTSAPHLYPLFYESLGLSKGCRFLEIGTGSGYGAALAREIVGATGVVVSIEVAPINFEFARANLRRAGYTDVILVKGDGAAGYVAKSPYDSIAITAPFTRIPEALIDQLRPGGKIVGPEEEEQSHNLVLVEKGDNRIIKRIVRRLIFVTLDKENDQGSGSEIG